MFSLTDHIYDQSALPLELKRNPHELSVWRKLVNSLRPQPSFTPPSNEASEASTVALLLNNLPPAEFTVEQEQSIQLALILGNFFPYKLA